MDFDFQFGLTLLPKHQAHLTFGFNAVYPQQITVSGSGLNTLHRDNGYTYGGEPGYFFNHLEEDRWLLFGAGYKAGVKDSHFHAMPCQILEKNMVNGLGSIKIGWRDGRGARFENSIVTVIITKRERP